jgi:hypothetical protein
MNLAYRSNWNMVELFRPNSVVDQQDENRGFHQTAGVRPSWESLSGPPVADRQGNPAVLCVQD